MDFEKIFNKISFALPIFHLSSCVLFMCGYAAGFGGGVGLFYSASDLFNVNVNHLVAIYLAGILFPASILFFRCKTGNIYLADKISKDKNSEISRLTYFISRHIVEISFPISAIILIYSIYRFEKSGNYVNYYLATTIVFALLAPLWWRLMAAVNLYGITVEIAWSFVTFCVSVFALGFTDGHDDRMLPFEEVSKYRMQCNKYYVLNAIGGNYVVVSEDGRRHMVTENCEKKFSF